MVACPCCGEARRCTGARRGPARRGICKPPALLEPRWGAHPGASSGSSAAPAAASKSMLSMALLDYLREGEYRQMLAEVVP